MMMVLALNARHVILRVKPAGAQLTLIVSHVMMDLIMMSTILNVRPVIPFAKLVKDQALSVYRALMVIILMK